MPIVDKRYPDKLTDSEIKECLRGYQKEIVEKKGHINSVLQFAPLVQLGLYELNNRNSNKLTKISLVIGFLAIIISLVAIFTSIRSNLTNEKIIFDQLEVLEEIRINTE